MRGRDVPGEAEAGYIIRTALAKYFQIDLDWQIKERLGHFESCAGLN